MKTNRKFYLAYGSNCNLTQMANRCPDATVVGPVTLHNYRLTFNGRSRAGGVANIRRRNGAEVKGLLWEITPMCERSLDMYEGFPHLYEKKNVTVETRDGERVKAMVYVMTKGHEAPALPSRGYYQGIIDGFRQNGMDEATVQEALVETGKELSKGEVIPFKGRR